MKIEIKDIVLVELLAIGFVLDTNPIDEVSAKTKERLKTLFIEAQSTYDFDATGEEALDKVLNIFEAIKECYHQSNDLEY